jgi:transposase
LYIDEAGIQEYIYRPYAKSTIGTRTIFKISGLRYNRQSIISARNSNNNLIAPFIYDQTADTDLIIYWVQNILLPELKLLNKKFTLVWDNAVIHKSVLMKTLIENQGHIILFLPPYSPDLNPIEHKWNELKQKLRKCYDDTVSFVDNLANQINLMSE